MSGCPSLGWACAHPNKAPLYSGWPYHIYHVFQCFHVLVSSISLDVLVDTHDIHLVFEHDMPYSLGNLSNFKTNQEPRALDAPSQR